VIAVLAAVLAGAVATGIRYLITRSVTVPWGVLVVNVVGSAIGGVVLGLAEAGALSADVRLVLLGGFCGGLTTFSALTVETIELVMAGKLRRALGSAGANFALGIGAAVLGYLIAR
jgi:CrcB protein